MRKNMQRRLEIKNFSKIDQRLTYLLAFLNYMNSNVMEGSFDANKILSNASQSKYSKSQGSSLADITDPKKRYAAVIQQEKMHERSQLHKKLQKQRQEEEKHYKKHLKAEIIKRKKELEYLELQKESGIEEQKKADHQAQLKKEKDAIKRMEDNIRAKTADQKSKVRYQQAKERQKNIDSQLNKKQTQAQYLRKVHLTTKNDERIQAVKFNQSLIVRQTKEEEKKQQLQKTQIDEYRRGLSLHGFNHKLLNNTKPVTLVFRENEEDGQAMSKAQKQELRSSERQKLREEAQLRNRKIAEQRGNQVFSKMQRQREYEAYCKEAEEQQRRYNLRRLQAGKKNQFAGVKPMTLSQIDLNKKIKSQILFEQMFIKDKKCSSKNNPASKYTMVENKMKDVVVPVKTAEKWVRRPINYAENQSLIPGVSEGHYSFESEASQEQISVHSNSKQSKKEAKVKPIMKETGMANQAVDSVGKTRLKETRLSNEALRQELNYSDSEEDSNI